MSLEKLKTAAATHGNDYVSLPAGELAAALKEAGEQDSPLAKHIAPTAAHRPAAIVHVHRVHHLGKLLGIAAAALET